MIDIFFPMSYLTVSNEDKWKWLSRLLYRVTMFARDTYAAEGDHLEDPQRMRRFHELSCLIAAKLKHFADGTVGMSDEEFVSVLGTEVAFLGIENALVHARCNDCSFLAE